jgi:hypothetical protein
VQVLHLLFYEMSSCNYYIRYKNLSSRLSSLYIRVSFRSFLKWENFAKCYFNLAMFEPLKSVSASGLQLVASRYIICRLWACAKGRLRWKLKKRHGRDRAGRISKADKDTSARQARDRYIYGDLPTPSRIILTPVPLVISMTLLAMSTDS